MPASRLLLIVHLHVHGAVGRVQVQVETRISCLCCGCTPAFDTSTAAGKLQADDREPFKRGTTATGQSAGKVWVSRSCRSQRPQVHSAQHERQLQQGCFVPPTSTSIYLSRSSFSFSSPPANRGVRPNIGLLMFTALNCLHEP